MSNTTLTESDLRSMYLSEGEWVDEATDTVDSWAEWVVVREDGSEEALPNQAMRRHFLEEGWIYDAHPSHPEVVFGMLILDAECVDARNPAHAARRLREVRAS